jgi:hypothetical protein
MYDDDDFDLDEPYCEVCGKHIQWRECSRCEGFGHWSNLDDCKKCGGKGRIYRPCCTEETAKSLVKDFVDQNYNTLDKVQEALERLPKLQHARFRIGQVFDNPVHLHVHQQSFRRISVDPQSPEATIVIHRVGDRDAEWWFGDAEGPAGWKERVGGLYSEWVHGGKDDPEWTPTWGRFMYAALRLPTKVYDSAWFFFSPEDKWICIVVNGGPKVLDNAVANFRQSGRRLVYENPSHSRPVLHPADTIHHGRTFEDFAYTPELAAMALEANPHLPWGRFKIGAPFGRPVYAFLYRSLQGRLTSHADAGDAIAVGFPNGNSAYALPSQLYPRMRRLIEKERAALHAFDPDPWPAVLDKLGVRWAVLHFGAPGDLLSYYYVEGGGTALTEGMLRYLESGGSI